MGKRREWCGSNTGAFRDFSVVLGLWILWALYRNKGENLSEENVVGIYARDENVRGSWGKREERECVENKGNYCDLIPFFFIFTFSLSNSK